MADKPTITLKRHSGECITIPVKWRGEAVALHRPLTFSGELSTTRSLWSVTHIESGLSAGQFVGPYTEALKLVKAWDHAFKITLDADKPDGTNWPLRKAWMDQLARLEPIEEPDVLEAIMNTYSML